MMFDVEIGDRVCAVAVQTKGDLLEVIVDGRAETVDARRTTGSSLSLLIGAPGTGTPVRSVDASIVAHRSPGRFDVHVDGRAVTVQIRAAGASGHRRTHGAEGPGQGPQRVVAPMPGKVVRVLVEPGQAVLARQGLIVIEAMKMENELRAGRDGQVREVAVAEGQSVEAGAVLVTIE